MAGDAEVRGGPRASASRSRGQRGAVSAEAMVVLPLLVAVTIGLVWVLALGVTQVRVVDAAREAARVAARGEPTSAASAAGRRVAPDDARVSIRRGGGRVFAEVTVEVSGPGRLFSLLPEVTVSSRSEAVAEETT